MTDTETVELFGREVAVTKDGDGELDAEFSDGWGDAVDACAEIASELAYDHEIIDTRGDGAKMHTVVVVISGMNNVCATDVSEILSPLHITHISTIHENHIIVDYDDLPWTVGNRQPIGIFIDHERSDL